MIFFLKKFREYSREINDYNGLCTCPAHSEYQTALIFHSAKNLKLNLKILNHIDTSNPIVPKGIEFSSLNDAHKKTIFDDLTNQLRELDNKFVNNPKNQVILRFIVRNFKYYGDNSKFENDILYSPISRIYREQKWG